MNGLLREAAAVVLSLPDRFAAGMRRWVIRQHQPEPVEDGGQPVAPYTICRGCGTPWPCATVLNLIDNNESVGNG